MSRPVRLALLWAAGLLLVFAGCGDRSADPPADAVLDPSSLEIPVADADSVDDTVRSLMAERQQQVRQALDREPFDAAAAAEALTRSRSSWSVVAVEGSLSSRRRTKRGNRILIPSAV